MDVGSIPTTSTKYIMYLSYGLSDTIKALKKMAVGFFLAGAILLSVLYLLISPAIASDYTSNYEKIHAIDRSPPRVAKWKYTPTVLVCEHAPIDQIRVSSTVAFWEHLGYKFYRTIYKENHLNKCTSPAPKGFIVVKLVSQEELAGMKPTTLAQTHFYVDNQTSEIEWAIIYLRTEPIARVFEHEIGHALGFLHYNKIGHLMHEYVAPGGWSTEGLDD